MEARNVFAENLQYYMKARGISRRELSEALGVSYFTLTSWVSGKKYPRMDKVELLADYFGVQKSDLIEEKSEQPPLIPGLEYPQFRKVPLLGTIACGEPILAEENLDGLAQVDGGVQCDFALRCKGDSMSPRLQDGDLVFIRQQPTVNNGQIAAVLIGDQATLKHVYVDATGVQLIAENPAYPPMVLIGEEAQTVRILGKAVAFQRSM